jgi:tetratricopeptide (TPR) repeat protein
MMNKIIKMLKAQQDKLYILLSVVVCIVLLFIGYGYYKTYREKCAYRVLTQALEYFDANVKKPGEVKEDDVSFIESKEFKTEQEKWEKVDNVFKSAYESNQRSSLAPLFLAYRSQALVHLKKLPEAIEILRMAINLMSVDAIKSYYQVKLALMLLDTSAVKSHEEALSLLTSLAQKESSNANDLALYHLGEYYWYAKKYTEAKNYWNQLIIKYGKIEKYTSPWVELAKEKLRLIENNIE